MEREMQTPPMLKAASASCVQPARLQGSYGMDQDTGVYYKPVSSALVDLEDLMHNKQI